MTTNTKKEMRRIQITGAEVLASALRVPYDSYKSKEGISPGEKEYTHTIKLNTSNKNHAEAKSILDKHSPNLIKNTWKGEELPKGQYVATFRSTVRTNADGETFGQPVVVTLVDDQGNSIEPTQLSPCESNNYTNNVYGFSSKLGDTMQTTVILGLVDGKTAKFNATYLKEVIVEAANIKARPQQNSALEAAMARAAELGKS